MALRILIFIVTTVFSANLAWAHSHTHVGRNQDQSWGTTDDNQLFFFSMPGTAGFPNWGEPLELIYQESGPLAGKYVCEELYCWHSAHPEDSNWQLGGMNEETMPDWRIALQRVSFDEGFSVLDYDTLAPVLTADGDIYEIPTSSMAYDETLYNEDGELGAWSFHHHQWFVADADGAGKTFTATFRAMDLGLTGYEASDEYTITFVTVPEPMSLLLLVLGGVLVRRRLVC